MLVEFSRSLRRQRQRVRVRLDENDQVADDVSIVRILPRIGCAQSEWLRVHEFRASDDTPDIALVHLEMNVIRARIAAVLRSLLPLRAKSVLYLGSGRTAELFLEQTVIHPHVF